MADWVGVPLLLRSAARMMHESFGTSLWCGNYSVDELVDGQPKQLGSFGVPYVKNKLGQRQGQQRLGQR